MTEKEKILIVVDMQHDFVDGSLGTPEAQAIVPKIEEKIRNGKYDKILYTFDTHDSSYFNTMEGKKLPVKHCALGTHGWSSALDCSFDDKNMVIKQTFGYPTWERYIDVDTKSTGWFSSDHKSNVDSIELCGVCTDICVIANALLLKTKLPEVQILIDASCCAGTTPEAHKAALTVMKSCQIDVINE